MFKYKFLLFILIGLLACKEKEDRIKDEIEYTQLDANYQIASNDNFQFFQNDCGTYTVPSYSSHSFSLDLDNDDTLDLRVTVKSSYSNATAPYTGAHYVSGWNEIYFEALHDEVWLATVPIDSISYPFNKFVIDLSENDSVSYDLVWFQGLLRGHILNTTIPEFLNQFQYRLDEESYFGFFIRKKMYNTKFGWLKVSAKNCLFSIDSYAINHTTERAIKVGQTK